MESSSRVLGVTECKTLACVVLQCHHSQVGFNVKVEPRLFALKLLYLSNGGLGLSGYKWTGHDTGFSGL